MRCDQYMGMTDEAGDFLEENQIPREVCPTCKQSIPYDLKTISHYNGMYMNEYPLVRFELKNGGHADQYLQAQPWSSGPIAFIGLKVFNKKDKLIKTFEWSQEDIDNV